MFRIYYIARFHEYLRMKYLYVYSFLCTFEFDVLALAGFWFEILNPVYYGSNWISRIPRISAFGQFPLRPLLKSSLSKRFKILQKNLPLRNFSVLRPDSQSHNCHTIEACAGQNITLHPAFISSPNSRSRFPHITAASYFRFHTPLSPLRLDSACCLIHFILFSSALQFCSSPSPWFHKPLSTLPCTRM